MNAPIRWFIFVLLTVPLSVQAQQTVGETYPLNDDVSTLDGIIRAYYEVVSGPDGQPRQVERDRSLHHPEASVALAGRNDQGEPYLRKMTLAEYHQMSESAGNPAFWEKEIHRLTSTFGQITHIWSTYEWWDEENGPVRGRGINSIQIYHDGNRYWITSWIYDSERPDNPLPSVYLPQE